MGLLHHDKLVVGFDLGEDFSQVSYCITEDYSVETLSSIVGEEKYNIPTVLCKRVGVNQWFYGKEALRCAEEDGGILVDNLIGMALDGEPVIVDDATYDPVSLLSLFIKRCLGMLSGISSPEKLYALMITCEKTDHRMIEVLDRAVAGMHLKTDRVFYQNHMESFYNYMLHQPEELWKHRTLLLEYRGSRILCYRMECNQRTSPVVAFVDQTEFAMTPYEPMPEEESLRRDKMYRMDKALEEIAEKLCSEGFVGAAYLIGEHYSDEWMNDSLRFLCRGRRVFQGNNLYSKGACLAMLERMRVSEAGKGHVFLGEDKLKSNIGMKILRRGEPSYLALLDAGVNWFEAENTVEFYVRDCSELEMQSTSMIGTGNRMLQFPLDGLPEGSSRLQAHLYMDDGKTLVMEVEDLGFGSLRPATHKKWRQIIEI